MSINMLSSKAEQLLDELLNASNRSDYLCNKYENATEKEQEELCDIINELEEKKYISVLWADDAPCEVVLNNRAYTYFDRNAEQKVPANEAPTINIIDQSVTIGNNNQITNTSIHGSSKSSKVGKQPFAVKHPILVSAIISLIVGFILLFSFWKNIINCVEGLF